ncbi:ErmE/ErmH/ErmO/ErmR family 23S rRNA (adenine(2058)-N(6))-methyltransferase [Streptomyces sp. NPDC059373]
MARNSARRELSQNFLVDTAAVRRIVQSARLSPHDLVLEPGAGTGAMTLALARHCRKVIAYEIDPFHATKLTTRTRHHRTIDVVRKDFLQVRPPHEPFAVVGNIPYSVTSPIVDWCLRSPHLTSATLLTQREYARKRAGAYGRWTLLTIRTWPTFTWQLAGSVDRQSFRPVPSVDSAVLRLVRRRTPLVAPEDMAVYDNLVRLGFSGIGGSLYASLRSAGAAERVSKKFTGAGIDRDLAVGFVRPDQWLTLFRELH